MFTPSLVTGYRLELQLQSVPGPGDVSVPVYPVGPIWIKGPHVAFGIPAGDQVKSGQDMDSSKESLEAVDFRRLVSEEI